MSITYNLSGPKQALLESLESAIQFYDIIVPDTSLIPLTGRILNTRGRLTPNEKECVLAIYHQLAQLASSGKMHLYAAKEFKVYLACEAFGLKKHESSFFKALEPSFKILRSVPHASVPDPAQPREVILADTLAYLAKAFDIDVPRKSVIKNISATTASALYDAQRRAILTVEDTYVPLVDGLFGVSIEAAAKYDGTSGIRELMRTPQLAIVVCDTDSGSQPFDVLRDTQSEIPPLPQWGELNKPQQVGIVKHLFPFIDKLALAYRAVVFAEEIVRGNKHPEPAPENSTPSADIGNLCDDGNPEKQSALTIDAHLHRQSAKNVEMNVPNQNKKPLPQRDTIPKYITFSSREHLRSRLGFDPEGVSLEKSLLRSLMGEAGYHGKNPAAIVDKLGFSTILEWEGHYFRYHEKKVQAFLKKLSKNGDAS